MENDYFRHPTAVIDSGARIGKGTKIWHFCHVMDGAKIGKNCVIGQNCFIGKDVVIGNGCKIQNNVSVYSKVTLEDNVFVGPGVVFTNDLTPRAEYPKHGDWLPTLIKKGVTIGANATILCDITIGEYAMIGAGSVVTADVPSQGLVFGNPARLEWWVCECGRKLSIDIEKRKIYCPVCKKKYRLTKDIAELFYEAVGRKCMKKWVCGKS